MISSVAVTLALAFWTPYAGGQPCPGGVTVHPASFGTPRVLVRKVDGVFSPHCEMWADPSVRYLPVADQCAWVAKNIGWTYMGLPNSNDPRNIMYSRKWVTPGACHPHRR